MRSALPILLAALVALTRAEYLLPSFDADLSAAVTTADGTFAGVPSSCNGHFNTACGNYIVSDIVEKGAELSVDLTTSGSTRCPASPVLPLTQRSMDRYSSPQ